MKDIPLMIFDSEASAISGDLRTKDLQISRFWADLYTVITDADICVVLGGHLRAQTVYPENHVFTQQDLMQLICIMDTIEVVKVEGWRIR